MQKGQGFRDFLNYIRRNPAFGGGLLLLLLLLLFSTVAGFFVPKEGAYPLAVMPKQAPSAEYPFGTDSVGRDLLPALIYGTRMTLSIGMISGCIGLGVGTVLGFMTGYFGGTFRHDCQVLRGRADDDSVLPSVDHHRRIGAQSRGHGSR